MWGPTLQSKWGIAIFVFLQMFIPNWVNVYGRNYIQLREKGAHQSAQSFNDVIRPEEGKHYQQIMTITKRKLKRPRLETLRWQICRALTASLPQKRPKVPSCDKIPSSWTGFQPTWTITLI